MSKHAVNNYRTFDPAIGPTHSEERMIPMKEPQVRGTSAVVACEPKAGWRKKVAVAIAALALTATSTVLSASPAAAAVRGLDLQVSGCNAQAPGTYIVLRAWNVYGW